MQFLDKFFISLILEYSFSFEVLIFLLSFFHGRISVTFRKMDESKLPYHYTPDPELLRVQPLVRRLPVKVSSIQQNSPNKDSIQLSVGENEKVKHDKPDTSLAQT